MPARYAAALPNPFMGVCAAPKKPSRRKASRSKSKRAR